MFESHMAAKTNIRRSTESQYRQTFHSLVSTNVKRKSVCDITRRDLIDMYSDLIANRDISVSTIKYVNSLLYQVMDAAVLDGMIRINPAENAIKDFKSDASMTEGTKALSQKQQKIFIEYCRKSRKYNKYAPMMTFFLGTGCRVGEVIALRWDDCDFENNLIHIRHSATTSASGNGHEHIMITPPKTYSGLRTIPMIPDVRDALLEQLESYDSDAGKACNICGLNNFVFLTIHGNVFVRQTIRHAIHAIVRSYNQDESVAAKKEGRVPELLPMFSCHVLRHTFCTRMSELNSNMTVVQRVMGHSNISTTMGIYVNHSMDAISDEFDRIKYSVG